MALIALSMRTTLSGAASVTSSMRSLTRGTTNSPGLMTTNGPVSLGCPFRGPVELGRRSEMILGNVR